MSSELTSEERERAHELAWLVRPCEQYKAEYKECTKLRSRFHQYFIHGSVTDCSSWKTDYKRCLSFRQSRDVTTLGPIIESERVRLRERLSGHLTNNVWESRTQPPDDWNKPLNSELHSRAEKTYFATMAKQKAESEGNSTPAEQQDPAATATVQQDPAAAS